MKASEYFVRGYFADKRHADQKISESFAIDDLLDFSHTDTIMFDAIVPRSYVGDPQFSGELCVSYDDMAELEWLSNFVEDLFFDEEELKTLQLLSSAAKTSANIMVSRYFPITKKAKYHAMSDQNITSIEATRRACERSDAQGHERGNQASYDRWSLVLSAPQRGPRKGQQSVLRPSIAFSSGAFSSLPGF
ncbi:hypothetical protein V8G54_036990 [Vigna mungo]|uniref:Uncharacterized protein n=1 Tax=Vigna mungo TaxID=3915 RepID=A0AAQ3MIB3_VIGMU